jgi:hypothetical protein
MDTGQEIRVAIRVNRAARTAEIDFTGTSAQHSGNYNAPAAITRAVVLYVFRTLVGKPIPLNEGCLRPLTLIVPEGSMLNPRSPAAVIAGNTEVSQAACNALYGALGVLAAGQGTMNNFVWGNDRFQNYETIAGGTGAGPGFAALPRETGGLRHPSGLGRGGRLFRGQRRKARPALSGAGHRDNALRQPKHRAFRHGRRGAGCLRREPRPLARWPDRSAARQ